MKNKAYSTFVVKEFDEEERIVRGIASTPATDRQRDIVEPLGAKFDLPFPLLYQHDHSMPIGQVIAAKATEKGIEITARLAKTDKPLSLKERLDTAYEEIKLGLVRGFSIGFRPIQYEPIKGTGGMRYTEYEIYETSAVTIPANQEANILSVKRFSELELGASANDAQDQPKQPASRQIKSVKFTNLKVKTKMNYTEMLKQLQATLAEKQSEVEAIQKAVADEGRTKNAEEREAFDTTMDEIKSLELEIRDVEKMVKANKETAKPVAEQPEQAKQYSGIVLKSAPEKLEPGIRFARFAKCIGAAKGDLYTAERIAQKQYKNDEQLNAVMKGAVDAGTTSTMSNLVDYQIITSDFIEYLRPRTIIGQFGHNGVPGLRRIPFNVTIKSQTSAGTAGWVGEGQYKPVTTQGFGDINLGWSKLAAISVASDELLRFSNPAAEALIRDDLAAAVIAEMDSSFIKANNAGNGSIKPKSVTYDVNTGTVPSSVSGSAEDRINNLWSTADSGNFDVSGAVYVTTPAVARKLASMKNALDQARFPMMTPTGGSIGGVPVVVSNHVDANAFWLVFANEIYLADDGQITVDASREASIVMSSTPQDDFDAVDGSTTAEDHPHHVSMFQSNQIALRAERYINWKLRRSNVVNGESVTSWT